jgi:hypothetical protein
MKPVDIGFVLKMALRKREINGDPPENVSSAVKSCIPFLIVWCC